MAEFMEQFRGVRLFDGRAAVVRNGYLPEREVQTGVGAVAVKVPKVRDRSGSGIKFHSRLLPPYLRRTRSMEELLPWLYLKGVSTGDFQEVLASLLGEQAEGLSPSTLSRLKRQWEEEHQRWRAATSQASVTCVGGPMECISMCAGKRHANACSSLSG
jgi:putative transposase